MTVYRFRLEFYGLALAVGCSKRLFVFAFGLADNVKFEEDAGSLIL